MRRGSSGASNKSRTRRRRDEGSTILLSNEPTLELVLRARTGDGAALEALLQRAMPQLRRWAHGRLPAVARGHIDTGDLVQDAAMAAIGRLDTFEPRPVGALQAYLRQSVINRIRDEMRRIGRRPAHTEISDELASAGATPQEVAIRRETYNRFHAALKRLRPKDRELVVARIEAQWTLAELTEQFGFPTRDAARMALTRALNRLKKHVDAPS